MNEVKNLTAEEIEAKKASATIRVGVNLGVAAPLIYYCGKRWKKGFWYKAGTVFFGINLLFLPSDIKEAFIDNKGV